MICLGGRVIGYALAIDLVQIFLNARFKCDARFKRRLDKITALEQKEKLK
jgi:ribose 5-phosphate isomerase B